MKTLAEYAKEKRIHYRTAWNAYKADRIPGAFKNEFGKILIPDEVNKVEHVVCYVRIPFQMLISDLNSKKISVRNPISIIVEEHDEESLARWPEVNACGLGPTLYEAIIDLKQNIVNLFLDLLDRDQESLGELAIETLNTLKVYISKEDLIKALKDEDN